MLARSITPTLQRLAAGFPVLAMTGPRQSGKTTLARALFADKSYVSLEDPVERAFAHEDPIGFWPASAKARSSTKSSAGPIFFRTCKAWWMPTAGPADSSSRVRSNLVGWPASPNHWLGGWA